MLREKSSFTVTLRCERTQASLRSLRKLGCVASLEGRRPGYRGAGSKRQRLGPFILRGAP